MINKNEKIDTEHNANLNINATDTNTQTNTQTNNVSKDDSTIVTNTSVNVAKKTLSMKAVTNTNANTSTSTNINKNTSHSANNSHFVNTNTSNNSYRDSNANTNFKQKPVLQTQTLNTPQPSPAVTSAEKDAATAKALEEHMLKFEQVISTSARVDHSSSSRLNTKTDHGFSSSPRSYSSNTSTLSSSRSFNSSQSQSSNSSSSASSTNETSSQTQAPVSKLTLKLKASSTDPLVRLNTNTLSVNAHTASGTSKDEPVGRRKVIDLDAHKQTYARPTYTTNYSGSSRPRHGDIQNGLNSRPTFNRGFGTPSFGDNSFGPRGAPGAHTGSGFDRFSGNSSNPNARFGADASKAAKAKKAQRSTKPFLDRNSGQFSFSTGMAQDLSDDISLMSEGWKRQKRTSGKMGINKPAISKDVEVYDGIEIKTLAKTTAAPMNTLLRVLHKLGVDMNKQSTLNAETAEVLVAELGHKPIVLKTYNPYMDPVEDFEGTPVTRAPIVTIVGHVDHGKTSLLDKIRNTAVVATEAGGITQHIGAYQVKDEKGRVITFLDTPGHETFTSMRARGIKLTDIVLLVVAADDGVQAQTVEAIKHIQAAGTPIIVVFTKIDKLGANVKPIKNILMSYGVITEEHGGEALSVEVSAHTGHGIKELLNTINTQAEMLDLKTRPDGHAIGIAIETKMVKGLGVTVNMIVQKGCLKIGDYFTIGNTYGKVRSMFNDKGESIKQAITSQPITLIGSQELCKPGDRLVSVPNEKLAKDTAEARVNAAKTGSLDAAKHPLSVQEMLAAAKAKSEEKEMKVFKLILKADTAGSVEALEGGLKHLDQTNAKIEIVMALAGPVVESDIVLAKTIGATIISFHIPVPGLMKKLAQDKAVQIMAEDIIYKIFEDVEKMMTGMKEIIYTEVQLGVAQIIKVFEFSKGNIAGCKVINGSIKRGALVKIMRKDQELARDTIKTMQKDMQSISEATKGFEIGLVLNEYNTYKVDDQIIAYEMQAS